MLIKFEDVFESIVVEFRISPTISLGLKQDESLVEVLLYELEHEFTLLAVITLVVFVEVLDTDGILRSRNSEKHDRRNTQARDRLGFGGELIY